MTTTNPEVWGPHYWFFLHTVSYNYPDNPNKVLKRKYYDLIMNFPVFIPDNESRKYFMLLLDKYPISPYLDNSIDFQKWVHFIHNKVNERLHKPQITRKDAYMKYLFLFEDTQKQLMSVLNIKKNYIYLVYILILIIVIYIYYIE
jgi:hypothetical protein